MQKSNQGNHFQSPKRPLFRPNLSIQTVNLIQFQNF
jgi:hypothetical protein